MDPSEFRLHGHRLVDWIAEYFEHPERYPVLSRVKPGDVRRALPQSAPEQGEPFDRIFADFERVIMPGVTHWNHPGFFAYFPANTCEPAVLGELVAAALNQQAMLWRTSPAATELEEVALGWLRDLMGLPRAFEGVIYDTASVSTLHALAAARERAVPGVRERGMAGRFDLPPLRLYCSEHAHSSVDKATMLLGLGHRALRKIPGDAEFRLRPDALGDAISADRAAGLLPIAVVATIGTTSSTSIDPVPALAQICREENLWLHVDAAYAGVAAIVPEKRAILAGCDRADSFVVNPHKWLFTPVDLSAFYTPHMDILRRAFALTPDYLTTADAGAARNLMDTGIQLGRRFRALKLWMILSHYGSAGLRERLSAHMALAQRFAGWVDDHPDFERVAPVPLSVVCFRARPRGGVWSDDSLDTLNERLIDAVNADGDVFLSHTKLDGRFTLRIAIGHPRTEERHVARAWDLLTDRLARLVPQV
ncbi:MAG: amino acid decarboxylase [Acidobacteria bacterium]|nr:amino acid decarboxylase [Acidobacteriota bacterium]MBI3262700.1 amino acid decarboxylase [Acidobacteriota bacterium]